MSTRQVLGAVGAAIGGYFFGAKGAQYGWMIGSTIGGVIDPEIIRGPTIGDIANQTSQEGIPRPIFFALSQPIAGNIIASGEPRIVRKRQRQGKGGPKVETETVYRTYAIGVGEGPITRFARVWRNGTLVYDVLSLDFDDLPPGDRDLLISNNQTFLEHARFFLGTWSQLPSPDLEAIWRVGTTPAHRGTAYLVMADEDLTDMRGAIPQYVFQVERCEGFFLTSRPYAVEAEDALGLGLNVSDGRLMGAPDDALSLGIDLLDGVLEESLTSYSNWPAEALDLGIELGAGELENALTSYSNWPAEALDLGIELGDGTLEEARVVYNNWPDEALDLGIELGDGTLEES